MLFRGRDGVLRVLPASRFRQRLIMGWVNTMAYALVAAVLLLIFVHPIGALATTSLDQRSVGLAAGLVMMFFSKRLILSLFCGASAFALAIEMM